MNLNPNRMSKLRRLFRYIAYSLLLVLVLFLLIAYALYLTAQRTPDFYRESLTIPQETQELRNREMLDKIRVLHNEVQEPEKTWSGSFTAEELNAYLAIEAVKQGANLIPGRIKEPRISFSDKTVDFACKLEEGPFQGVVHFEFGLTVPEPNRFTLRIKEAKLGKLPISKERSIQMLKEAVEKRGRDVVLGNEAGDPTLTLSLDLKYGKKRSIYLENVDFSDGMVRFVGTTEKTGKKE